LATAGVSESCAGNATVRTPSVSTTVSSPSRSASENASLEVEHDRALVAVGGVVVGRAPLRIRRRQPAPRVVAGRRLDLDHIRPEVAERLPDERAGEHPREIDHEDPIERRRHAGTLLNRTPVAYGR
jgi:hypothetical protein